MKKTFLLLQFTGLLFLASSFCMAQGTQPKSPASTAKLSPEEIIKRFTEKESELREVLQNFI